tara:strand:+ start:3378 stop:5363 length:1986 start_codon:yes stop_codon:yes gene_type:complete
MVMKRVHAYFNNDSTTHCPGIISRLSGKEGRMRNNLMGFRVNLSARAVIIPDPYCHPAELRIPAKIFDTLRIKDGETVLFNRQPSLHKGSMMAHRARRGAGNAFAFSPTVTAPYNADYDGDEMNLHKLDNIAVQAEAQLLMGVAQNMHSPASGKPWIKLVQDCVLSEYLQGKQLKPPANVDELHERQVASIDYIQRVGFSIGLDDFCNKVTPVGDPDMGCLARTADTICDKLHPSNSLLAIVKARSKGSSINLTQLMSCVGWQTVQGKPSVGPRGTSFVKSSYVEGLDVDEFWHHACAGREGLIQTAIKTSKTGYLQRKLIKFMEDIRVAYDGTTRHSGSGMVIRFDDAGAEPGTPVGCVAAQSIGQPITQSTLNMFHKAGIECDTGLAKMQSILEPSSNTQVYCARNLQDAHLLLSLDSRGTEATDEPSLYERVEADMRNTRVPRRRYVHRCPEKFDGWMFAALLRKHASYAHYVHADNTVMCDARVVNAKGLAGVPAAVAMDRVTIDTLGDTGYCTNPIKMQELYGIEAAREMLYMELKRFGTIFDKHYELLADAMTSYGQITSVNRSGVEQTNSAAFLGRACFETVSQIIADSSFRQAADSLKSASSRLAVGVAPRAGTTSFDVMSQHQHTERPRKRSAVATFLDDPIPVKKTFRWTN